MRSSYAHPNLPSLGLPWSEPIDAVATYGGFALTGVVTTLLGPILPFLLSRWSLDDARAGSLFAAQFLASLAGSLVSGPLMARFGPRLGAALGYSLMVAGTASLALSSWPFGLAAIACYGVGLGVVIPAVNLGVAERHSGNPAAALNLLNFTWCFGAVAAPLLVVALRQFSLSQLLLGLAALLLLPALAAPLAMPRGATAVPCALPPQPALASRRSFFSPGVLLTAALLFLYVGTENGVNGWMGLYACRVPGGSEASAKIAQSAFWAAILIGRLAAPAYLRRWSAQSLVLAGLSVNLAGVTLVIATTAPAGVLCGMVVAGCGLAAVFPTAVALFTARFGPAARRLASLPFAFAALGGATLPWIVGQLSTHAGSLRVGNSLLLAASAAMILVHLAVRRTSPLDSVR